MFALSIELQDDMTLLAGALVIALLMVNLLLTLVTRQEYPRSEMILLGKSLKRHIKSGKEGISNG